jgi:hypothetical protein
VSIPPALEGPRWQLLELLAALPDDAGVQAVGGR